MELFQNRWVLQQSFRLVPSWILSPLALFLVRLVASRFIAGNNPAQAKPKIEELRKQGAPVILHVLGEGLVTRKSVQAVVGAYLRLLREMDKPCISIKLSTLSPNFDALNQKGQNEVKTHLRQILLAAQEIPGSLVYLDMEDYKLKHLTLKISGNFGRSPI